MLINFEDYTHDLNQREQEIAFDLACAFEGFDKAMTAKDLVLFCRTRQYMGIYKGYRFDEVRIRKFINFICKFFHPNLIGTSRGYVLTNDIDELKRTVMSLRSRSNENNTRADIIIKHLSKTHGVHEKG